MAEKFPYEDIVELPPHISQKYPQPTMMERAARFAPFAAITGYEEMVIEETRQTQDRIELDDSAREILNKKLRILWEQLHREPEVRLVYFEADIKKSGGTYTSVAGTVRHMDLYRRSIGMSDGREIFMEDLISLDSSLFDSPELSQD